MAALVARRLPALFSRRAAIIASTVRTKDTMLPDPLELATGLEKKELLAELAGNDDPYNTKVIKRGPGTREKPNEIPSAMDSRIIGCICEEDALVINWMWLYMGEAKRCSCGHWFKLVHKETI